MRTSVIWAEMARRKVMFHPEEKWNEITLWGLFSWGAVSPLLKRGLLITHMKKENRTIWVRPSEEAWTKHIEPLLKRHSLAELTTMAGWN